MLRNMFLGIMLHHQKYNTYQVLISIIYYSYINQRQACLEHKLNKNSQILRIQTNCQQEKLIGKIQMLSVKIQGQRKEIKQQDQLIFADYGEKLKKMITIILHLQPIIYQHSDLIKSQISIQTFSMQKESFLKNNGQAQTNSQPINYLSQPSSLSLRLNKPNMSLNDSEEDHETQPQDKQDLDLINSIKILLVSPNYSNQFLFLKISEKLCFKIEILRDDHGIIIQGILVHLNGLLFEIPEGYKNNLYQSLDKKNEQGRIFTVNNSNLKFRAYTAVKNALTFEDMSMYSFMALIQKIKKNILILKQELTILGLTKTYNSKTLKLKRARLQLMKTTCDILTDKTKPVSNEIETSNKKGSVFTYYSQINEINQNQIPLGEDAWTSIKYGGSYFQVQKQICNLVDQNQQILNDVELAVKSLKPSDENKKYSLEKIKRQLRIMNQITEPEHFLKYWIKKENNNAIYMEYVNQNLDDHIYFADNSIGDLINFASQIVEGVSVLENSGIVHRDLKPDNILVAKDSNKQRHLKIIDFGESTHVSQIFQKKSPNDILGSTIPYSPPETLFSSKESFNKKQIDYWSIGMLIYEITFKNCPVTYSRSFGKDAYKSWWTSNQFSIFPLHYKKQGIQIIQMIVTLIAINSICIQQSQRINLEKMKKILQATTTFLKQILQ